VDETADSPPVNGAAHLGRLLQGADDLDEHLLPPRPPPLDCPPQGPLTEAGAYLECMAAPENCTCLYARLPCLSRHRAACPSATYPRCSRRADRCGSSSFALVHCPPPSSSLP
jgi:hypothetical protein